MSDFDYDLIVIGAGSGGTRTARISASYGAKTLVIEGDRAGGTCVLRGCVPKKLLVATRAEIGSPTIIEKKRAIVETLSDKNIIS